MNLIKPIHHAAKFCFGLVISTALLLAGCGGGGSGNSTAQLNTITVLPAFNAVAVGHTIKLSAIGKYSDGTHADITAKVTWTSSSPATASVNSATGVVTGAAFGSANITAVLNGVSSPVVRTTVTTLIVPTIGLATARWDHSANLLPASGVAAERVLVAGGYTAASSVSAALDSSELYDPNTDTWSVTNGRLNTPRADHTATRLQNGQTLVAGGANDTDSNIASSELFDPNTGLWSMTTGSLVEGRSYHTATLLADGMTVLVTGGGGVNNPSLSSSELYNSGGWTTTGNLAKGRYSHTATLLPNGKVLAVGGVQVLGGVAAYLGSSELYSAGAWSATGNLAKGRFSHAATLLTTGINAGKVLVTGGVDATGFATNSVELYDPAFGTWSTITPLATARALHTATQLPNGKILVMGGDDFAGHELSSIELYDPASLLTTPIFPVLTSARDNFTATLLSTGPNAGKVLATGGYDGAAPLAITDLH